YQHQASGAASAPRVLVNLNERILTAHRARAEATWLRPSCLRDALTALSLATDQRNLFRLEERTRGEKGRGGEGAKEQIPPPPPSSPSPHRPFLPPPLDSSSEIIRAWLRR